MPAATSSTCRSRISTSSPATAAKATESRSTGYAAFSDRFPFEETEDQDRAIDDVIADLAKGRPMDRLICGDVGFGKTEVALRSAFLTVMNGKQVAVVVPTTLLARQHYATFLQRFQNFPIRVEQASRLVPRRHLNAVKEGLTKGD